MSYRITCVPRAPVAGRAPTRWIKESASEAWALAEGLMKGDEMIVEVFDTSINWLIPLEELRLSALEEKSS